MKLTAILSCGTYYSPWTPFTIASIYNAVDNIVVVNGGYDIKSPSLSEYNIPLDMISKTISNLDCNGKITEIVDFTVDDLDHKFKITTQHHANAEGLTDWYDMRGLGGTLANEVAVKEGATHILKIDSDQVCYHDVIPQDILGSIFYQYEFVGDIGFDAPNQLAVPGPDDPYNDSVFTYAASIEHFYGGGMGPHVGDRTFIDKYHCAHLRSANPALLSEGEKFEHFFGRLWFRYFTNDGLWGDALNKRASDDAKAMLLIKGKATNISPPEVCLNGK